MNWEPAYALLLFASTFITFFASIGMARYHSHKKAYIIVSIILNLSILFFFKYFNWAAENVTIILSWLGISMHVPEFKVLLPVGISFYIFQALGYSIDVYYGKVKVERNFFRYALFVSFFPQLVAGPIERSTNLLQQFYKKHSFSSDFAINGCLMMLWGYFMKLVVADRVGLYVDSVYNNVNYHSGSSLALATILFGIQIYCDFAGYTYIAIGCARIMGFKLMDNFHRPYFSTSVKDFWHRWHISFSTWLRDYVYIPLGGSRCSKLVNYRNLLLTFFISGIWHGAAWTFVIWGTIHGFCLIFEKIFNVKSETKNIGKKICKILSTFIIVNLAWIFFRANNLSDAIIVFKTISTTLFSSLFIDKTTLFYSFIGIFILLLGDILLEYQIIKINNKNHLLLFSMASIFLISVILLFGVFDGGQFIYFQF